MSTILLVDDEQDTLDLFTEVLEQMNHRVLKAHDGREALSIALQTPLDLVVTDWMMPHMDGLELCHRLHEDERLQDIPIILHSSTGNPHVPGAQFIPKDHPMEKFERLVSQLLACGHAQRSAASPTHEGDRAPPEHASRHTDRWSVIRSALRSPGEDGALGGGLW